MSRSEVLEEIRTTGLIAILRGYAGRAVPSIVESLIAGGCRAVEVTMNSESAVDLIAELAERFKGRAQIGAGTVLSPQDAEHAIRAGAAFLVAPNLNPQVLQVANTKGCAVFPGAMTPTEIEQAYSLGADAVKVFPSDVLGPAYIRAVRAPLPHIPLVPTGGVSQENAADYIRAGAIAVGVGSHLVPKAATDGTMPQLVQTATEEFLAVIQSAKRALSPS
ncbi:MAG: bifunctional 4-hydroxy-2-oxoglutarate aldolase/2-dehydro-3-deoxy-phosphogluconate aldolase [Alicyclobacillaceae bacterium]|nr:bifunctional 4-hydroxy-2-oxoglutarate aldolase/2-dehydro-3-deoxy-phosphogluconate aldolase [Alicyclobacillaceae bacterium]